MCACVKLCVCMCMYVCVCVCLCVCARVCVRARARDIDSVRAGWWRPGRKRAQVGSGESHNQSHPSRQRGLWTCRSQKSCRRTPSREARFARPHRDVLFGAMKDSAYHWPRRGSTSTTLWCRYLWHLYLSRTRAKFLHGAMSIRQ